MQLQTTIITFLAVIGVVHSDIYEPLDSTNKVDSEYRPWTHGRTSTVWISLEAMGIASVNSNLQLNIPNLEWLVLDNNQISVIQSQSFINLPNLTYISLAGNQISVCESDAFDYLDKLEVLDLDQNSIGGNLNCDVFSQVSTLKRLYLRNNGISTLNQLPECVEGLSHLYLTQNALQIFYTGYESNLTHLYLDNNQLNYVSLFNLKSLIYLNLQSNSIKRIVRRSEVPPDYYEDMMRQGYNLQDESTALYLHGAVALQTLIVSANQLSRIDPDTFRETEALVHLDLSGNQFSEVYAGTFNDLLYLEEILLDSNQIVEINRRAFINLPNLRIISLKNNKINDLDEDVFSIKLNSTANEVYLFLDNNEIDTLRRGSFRGIQGLKHIGLSGNRIKSISSQTFVDLPNLESIVIEHQSLDQSSDQDPNRMRETSWWTRWQQGLIESDAFFNLSSLSSIIIRENSFTQIEARAFHNLPKLTTLDLRNNSIETVSSEAFVDLPAIENLYLGDNLISIIAPNTFPTHLKHLDLSWNNLCSEFSCWHLEELRKLDKLDVTGIIDRFKVEDYSSFLKNLTVIVGKAAAT